jgi:hypothetical protein
MERSRGRLRLSRECPPRRALGPDQAQRDPERRAGGIDALHSEHMTAVLVVAPAKDAAGNKDIHECPTIFAPSTGSPIKQP